MSTQQPLSWATAASLSHSPSGKRVKPGFQPATICGRPNFINLPTTSSQEYLTLLQQDFLQPKVHEVLPKSVMEHGLHVKFAEYNPLCLPAILKVVNDAFPKATCFEEKYLKGFFDLGFATQDEAVAAAGVSLTLDNCHIPTQLTRYHQDSLLFVSFEALPTNIPKDKVIKLISDGISEYGVVGEVSITSNPLLPHIGGTTGFATLTPNSKVNKDISLIPCCATLHCSNSKVSRPFQVYPERAPPLCILCNGLGHCPKACPSSLAGLKGWDGAEGPDGEPIDDAFAPAKWGSAVTITQVPPCVN